MSHQFSFYGQYSWDECNLAGFSFKEPSNSSKEYHLVLRGNADKSAFTSIIIPAVQHTEVYYMCSFILIFFSGMDSHHMLVRKLYMYVVVTNILCTSHSHHVLYTLRKSSDSTTQTKIKLKLPFVARPGLKAYWHSKAK